MVTARHDTDELRALGESLADVLAAMTVTFRQAAGANVGDLGSPRLADEVERFRSDWRMGERRIGDNVIDAMTFLRQAAEAYEAIESSAIDAMGPQ